MNKNLNIVLVVLVIVGVGAYFFINRSSENVKITQQPQQLAQGSAFDGRSASFAVDDRTVTLVNGFSEIPIANSSSKITTRYFGNEATGDLNGDGLPDQAFLITQNTGGGGTFYYVVVAMKNAGGYKTTNAFLIGDRIAPQSTEIHSDSQELYVNFAERKPGEPMTTQPSIGVTLFLKVTPDGVLEGLMR